MFPSSFESRTFVPCVPSPTKCKYIYYRLHLIWNTITVEDGAFRWVVGRGELVVKREGMKNRSVAVMTNTRAVIT